MSSPASEKTLDLDPDVRIDTLKSSDASLVPVGDELPVVLSDDAFPHKTDEERRLVRKLDKRILPLVCLMYLCAFLDRSNLGNARLQGLPEDALGGDADGKKFDWVVSVFFFSYIMFQVPATLVAKLFPPCYWLGGAAIGWGLCSTLMAIGFNFAGLVTARVALGVFEACFGPGIPLYFSLFYTKSEIGLRLAYWFSFAAVAGAFGGLIAFGVQQIHSAVANWRLLFIIEGIPTVLLGVVTVWLLPNRPETTRFLNDSERELALERANRGTSGDIGYSLNRSQCIFVVESRCASNSSSSILAHIVGAFKDWRIYLGGIIYFGANAALASISAFLPTIIETFGFTNARAQLLTVPPYAVCAVVLTLLSWVSDRLQTRGPFVAISGVVVTGTYTTIGLVIAWFSHNLGSETKRATGTPLYMAIGQGGSVLGSHLFPQTQAPIYTIGFSVLCALEFLGAVCAIILSASYTFENARRNRVYGRPNPETKVDTSILADKAPCFRYAP
ncbi:MFS general substrate transporter [Amylostereum chailletii]|nr:MFS general substrate transporter [Amylostereum chailletii]